jgi:hypothetical protein
MSWYQFCYKRRSTLTEEVRFTGSMMQRAQARTVRGGKQSALPNITPQLERRWFEFDRTAVLRQIDLVQGAIGGNVGDLEMVAVEGVFEKGLSGALSRTSRALHVIDAELTALRGLVTHTSHYPRAGKQRS